MPDEKQPGHRACRTGIAARRVENGLVLCLFGRAHHARLLKSGKNGEYVELPTGFSPMLPGVSVPQVKIYASHKEFLEAYGKIVGDG